MLLKIRVKQKHKRMLVRINKQSLEMYPEVIIYYVMKSLPKNIYKFKELIKYNLNHRFLKFKIYQLLKKRNNKLFINKHNKFNKKINKTMFNNNLWIHIHYYLEI